MKKQPLPHRAPLPKKKIVYSDWLKEKHPGKIKVYERVLFLNPAIIYKRVAHKLNDTKRHAGLQMEDIFPKVEGKCACGCKKLPESGTTWQRKWATLACQEFASDVLSIMNNYFGRPAYYISLYYGKKCCECEETRDLELDHILGVKHGGGACWLSNYRWLCKKHHTEKTNKDFGHKMPKPSKEIPGQIKLL